MFEPLEMVVRPSLLEDLLVVETAVVETALDMLYVRPFVPLRTVAAWGLVGDSDD